MATEATGARQAIFGTGIVNDMNLLDNGTNGRAQVVDYELEVERPGIDATSFDSSGWNEYISGVAGWRGSFSGLMAAGMSNTIGLAAGVLGNFIASGSVSETYPFYLTVTTASNSPTYTGNCQITEISFGQSVGDLCRYRMSFEGYGVLTYTTS